MCGRKIGGKKNERTLSLTSRVCGMWVCVGLAGMGVREFDCSYAGVCGRKIKERTERTNYQSIHAPHFAFDMEPGEWSNM